MANLRIDTVLLKASCGSERYLPVCSRIFFLQTLFMWIGQSTSPEVIKDLFDVESVAQLPETHVCILAVCNYESSTIPACLEK